MTDVLEVPVTVAENCFVSPDANEAEVGLIEIATAGGLGLEPAEALALPPPQPVKVSAVRRVRPLTIAGSRTTSLAECSGILLA